MTARIYFHPSITVFDAARIARQAGRVLAQEQGRAVLKVRCDGCRHLGSDSIVPKVGWCRIHQGFRSRIVPIACKDFRESNP